MTNHTTPETSAEILRLCEEKGVDAPEMITRFKTLDVREIPESGFDCQGLLMWSGWGDWSRKVEVHDRAIFALAVPRGHVFAEHTAEGSTPAEALGLLLIEYLRTL